MDDTRSTLRALVVHESMFGNTERIALAVAQGLRAGGAEVSVVAVADAPDTLPARSTCSSWARPPMRSP